MVAHNSPTVHDEAPRLRVYLAYTPYHLLLSLALQDRDGDPNAVLLFSDEAGIIDHAPDILSVTGPSCELRAAPTLEGRPLWKYPFLNRATARFVQRFIEERDTEVEIFTFNGLRPESHRLFNKLPSGTRFEYVEDGLDAYVACNHIDVARWYRVLYRALFGNPYPFAKSMADRFSYRRYNVVAPELFGSTAGPVAAIPNESVLRATVLLRRAIQIPTPERKISHLYVLSNTERVPDRDLYLRSLRSWIDDVATEDPSNVVAVKAHPRERNVAFRSAIGELGVYVVPHWVPLEVITPSLSPSASVYCGLSTFILTSRYLLPQRMIYLDSSVPLPDAQFFWRWDQHVVRGPRDTQQEALA